MVGSPVAFAVEKTVVESILGIAGMAGSTFVIPRFPNVRRGHSSSISPGLERAGVAAWGLGKSSCPDSICFSETTLSCSLDRLVLFAFLPEVDLDISGVEIRIPFSKSLDLIVLSVFF